MNLAGLQPLLDHAVPFTLVLFRLAGLFVMTPVLMSVVVPARGKAFLVTSLAAATYPAVASRVQAPEVPDVFSLLPLIATESLIGVVIGALAALPILAMEMAGVVAGQTMGFGLARVYNPEADVDADLLGQLLMYVATGVFVGVGGLERLYACVLGSFDRVPIGGLLATHDPLGVFVGVLSSGMELAMRVALPVVGVCLLLVVVLGVIGKTMPAFNIMSVGFTLKIMAGILVLAAAASAAHDAVGAEIGDVLAVVSRWANPTPGMP